MIAPSSRVLAVELIQEANRNGARLAKACQELNISVRTYERWVSDGDVKVDQRPLAQRPTPKNKLSQKEKDEIITIVKQDEYADLPPTPNQVWTWDITWLGGPVRGLYYRIYLILDLFSRKVVGWEVWETEEAKYATTMLTNTDNRLLIL